MLRLLSAHRPPGPAPVTYVVRRGDTLAGIAMRVGVPLSALEASTPRVAAQRFIFPGDRLSIPTVRNYQVQRGDTLSAIATRYGTSVAVLADANRIANPDRISTGQMLVIVGPAVPRPAPVRPADRPAPRRHRQGRTMARASRR